MGRRRREDLDPRLGQRIRAAIMNGASNDTIKRDFEVGSSVPERIRRELAAEKRAKALVALEPLIEAATRGGLTRRQIANILWEAAEIEIETRGER